VTLCVCVCVCGCVCVCVCVCVCMCLCGSSLKEFRVESRGYSRGLFAITSANSKCFSLVY
jgi:hypothetical protein